MGVSMRLEIFYKAFVGDDVGFLEPINPLPDINVYAAARVRNGEEGVLENHLVGNVPEMDPHVLEVGHRVV